MANHPNRNSQISNDTFVWHANISVFLRSQGASDTETWSDGPTYNNRPARKSIRSSDLNDIANHVLRYEHSAHNARARRAMIDALQAMPVSSKFYPPSDADVDASEAVWAAVKAVWAADDRKRFLGC